MTYLVLARKHRPKIFDNVVGQDHISRVLKYSVVNNRVSHALLFSGPKGTGKTTMARIIARAVNCESVVVDKAIPCGHCNFCSFDNKRMYPDIFEIDGASNNGVEQIRDLKENVSYSPINSKYKVYIIDEVHMLSRSAFNALLKTLEEPPSHVIFILATTECQKIPQTIISRCQHHRFKRINYNTIKKYLIHICKLESMKIDVAILHEIAKASDGSLRDALTMLDQVTFNCDNNISIDSIANIVGIIDGHVIHDFTKSILSKNVFEVFEKIDFLYRNGYDLNIFYNKIMTYLKNLLVFKKTNFKTDFLFSINEIDKKKMFSLISKTDVTIIEQILYILFKEEVFLKGNIDTKLAFEIICLKINNTYPVISVDNLIERITLLKKIVLNNINKEKKQNLTNKSSNILNRKYRKLTKRKKLSNAFMKAKKRISKVKPSLAAILFKSNIVFKNNKLVLIEVLNNKYYFNSLKKNLSLIKDCVTFYFDKDIKIEVIDNASKKDKNEHIYTNEENRILNDSVVTDAIKVFDAKIDSISTK